MVIGLSHDCAGAEGFWSSMLCYKKMHVKTWESSGCSETVGRQIPKDLMSIENHNFPKVCFI